MLFFYVSHSEFCNYHGFTLHIAYILEMAYVQEELVVVKRG